AGMLGAVCPPDLVQALQLAPGLPNLRRLFVGFVDQARLFGPKEVVLSWLFEAPLAKRLEVLGVSLSPHTGLARWKESLESRTTAIRELRFLPAAALGSPSSIAATPGHHIRLVRQDPTEPFTTLSVATMPVRDPAQHADLTVALIALRSDALTRVDLT